MIDHLPDVGNMVDHSGNANDMVDHMEDVRAMVIRCHNASALSAAPSRRGILRRTSAAPTATVRR